MAAPATIDWMNPQGQQVNLGLSPGDTSWYQTEAPRYMAGFASNDPQFQNYWNQYGSDPSMATPDFWESGQGTNWMQRARAGGDAERDRQHAESQKKGFLGLGKLGDVAAMAALAYFGGPALSSMFGGGAGAGAAMAGEAAFGGGMASELAWGAPELAGMAAGGSSLAGGGMAAELAWGAPELAGMAAGNFANAALPTAGFFSNLFSNPMSSLKSLMPGERGGVPTTGPFSGGGGAGALPWGTMASVGSIATGLMGLNERKKLQEAGMRAAEMQDPAGPLRPMAQRELIELMRNPAAIVKRPGFDAGRLAVDRSMAGQGYLPASRDKVSGNYLDAMSNYGSNFYNQELARLMAISGVNIPPSGGNLMLSGQMGSSALTGQAIQSILAGIRGLG